MSKHKLIVVDKKGRAFRPCDYHVIGPPGLPCWVPLRGGLGVAEEDMRPYEFYVLSEPSTENSGDKSDITAEGLEWLPRFWILKLKELGFLPDDRVSFTVPKDLP